MKVEKTAQVVYNLMGLTDEEMGVIRRALVRSAHAGNLLWSSGEEAGLSPLEIAAAKALYKQFNDGGAPRG